MMRRQAKCVPKLSSLLACLLLITRQVDLLNACSYRLDKLDTGRPYCTPPFQHRFLMSTILVRMRLCKFQPRILFGSKKWDSAFQNLKF